MASLSTQMLLSLFAQCATDVAPETLHTVIGVESSRNPYAIAVVYDSDVKEEDKFKFKQPQSEDEALAIPKQIGDVIDAKLQEKLDELSAGIGKALEVIDDAGTEMHTAFSKSVLDLNNQVITSLDSFSNKKIEEIKKSFESVQPQKSQAKSEVLNKSKTPLLWILTGLTIINIAVSGFILTKSKQPEKDKETAYQVGLYKGFEEVKKIAPKEADKIQKIIISNIDNELKSK